MQKNKHFKVGDKVRFMRVPNFFAPMSETGTIIEINGPDSYTVEFKSVRMTFQNVSGSYFR